MSYAAFVRVAVLRNLAYRANYWMTLTGTAGMVIIQYCLWNAVYPATGSVPGGMTRSETLTYVLMARAAAAFLTVDCGRLLARRVRLGTVAAELARPIDPQGAMFAESLGESLYGLVLVAAPTFLVLGAVGVIPWPELPRLGAFLVSLALGFVVMFGLSLLVGMCGFWTRAGWGFADFLEAAMALLSGALIPLDYYPLPLRSLAAVLPFQAVYHLPLSVVTGRAELSAAVVLQQLGWAVALLTVCRLMWRPARAALVIQGG